ncbi:MAG: AtpZ/AtpI family protein [Candidatus Marinimicrobia bacterium]|nr:AtpZ/AtpI family protein [Candidatus Neomarinimicrobiota bacterium]
MTNKNQFQRAAGAGYTILGALLVFGLLGNWLDGKFETGNKCLIGGLFLGVIVGMYELGKFVFKK